MPSRASRCCDNFLYGFTGAPAARRAVPALAGSVQDRDALREFVRRREVDRQKPSGVAGLLGSSWAATCPRPTSGSPPVAGAAAAPMPRTRRQAVPAVTFPQRRVTTKGRAVLRPPGSVSPGKDHHQGRACGASPLRAADP